MATHASGLNEAPASGLPSRGYAWVVFILTFGLLLSDYMSRQVLNAVFPLLKTEWRLTDTELGSLTGVVALMVGILTVPLSLAADKIGRVASVTIMALIWSAATLACGLAQNYEQMLGARLLVGVGEAAYGSVGLAIVFSVFPPSMRATMTGAFMAGGIFGSVIGIALGGLIAEQFGWRASFISMAAVGLLLGAVYPLIVKSARGAKSTAPRAPAPLGAALRNVFGSAQATITYLASGLQLFVVSAFMAWTPSLLNRAYAMSPGQAAAAGSAFILISGIGMILCGVLADRVTKARPERKATIAAVYCGISFVCLTSAFLLPAGNAQLSLMAAGLFFAAGSTGPSGAIVVERADPALHATVLATLTLANNLIGLAPGPIVSGFIADQSSLLDALRIVPAAGLLACFLFLAARSRRFAPQANASHGLASG